MRIISVVPYDPSWPEQFELEAAKIQQALGDNCIHIHHIGSTAVPGLDAKPVIDMIPVVKNIRTVDSCNEVMEALGYSVEGEFGTPFRRFFIKGGDQRTHNIHVYEKGNPEIERHVTFRDHLRAHPDVAAEYAKLKQEVASKSPHDIVAYCNGKTEWVTEIERQLGITSERMMRVCTDVEIATYKRIREEQLADHPTLPENDQNISFVYIDTPDIVAIADVEFLKDGRARIFAMAVDSPHQDKGYDQRFKATIAKWLSHQNRTLA